MDITDKQRDMILRKLHWTFHEFTPEERESLKTTVFSRADASIIINNLINLEASNPFYQDQQKNREVAIRVIKELLAKKQYAKIII